MTGGPTWRVSGGAIHPGDGSGGFGAPLAPRNLPNHDLLTAAGDLNGDGRNDLVARRVADGRLDLFIGNGAGGFVRRALATGWSRYNAIAATGDLNGDGHDDLLARDGNGRLWRFAGAGRRSWRRWSCPGRGAATTRSPERRLHQ